MGAKILVFDDEQDMVDLLTYNLKARGYEVRAASNGLDALKQARLEPPDLILLDLMLDGIDGYSVCEILRHQPSTATVPVIMITAMAGQIARVNGLAAGADDFMTKPFSPQELVTRIKRVLELRAEKARQAEAENPL